MKQEYRRAEPIVRLGSRARRRQLIGRAVLWGVLIGWLLGVAAGFVPVLLSRIGLPVVDEQAWVWSDAPMTMMLAFTVVTPFVFVAYVVWPRKR